MKASDVNNEEESAIEEYIKTNENDFNEILLIATEKLLGKDSGNLDEEEKNNIQSLPISDKIAIIKKALPEGEWTAFVNYIKTGTSSEKIKQEAQAQIIANARALKENKVFIQEILKSDIKNSITSDDSISTLDEKPKTPFLQRTFEYLRAKIDSKYVEEDSKSEAHKLDDRVQNLVNKYNPFSFLGGSLSGYLFPKKPKTWGGTILKFCANAVDTTKWLVFQSVKQPAMAVYQSLGTVAEFGRLLKNTAKGVYNAIKGRDKNNPEGNFADAKKSFQNLNYRATECLKATGASAVLAGIATVTAMTAGLAIPVLTPVVSAIPGVTSTVGLVSAASSTVASTVAPAAGNVVATASAIATKSTIKSTAEYAIKHPITTVGAAIVGAELGNLGSKSRKEYIQKKLNQISKSSSPGGHHNINRSGRNSSSISH